MALNLRDVTVFAPYPDEFPEDLLMQSGANDRCLDRWQGADVVRIGKVLDRIVAVYAMTRDASKGYHLHGIVVEPGSRGQGIGRWMTGHAIGVAESKGARYLTLTEAGGSQCFERLGFVADAVGLRFDLIPE